MATSFLHKFDIPVYDLKFTIMDLKIFFNKVLYGGGKIFDLLKWVFLLIIVLVLIFNFVISIFIVDGLSMEPTLHDGEWVLLQKNAYTSKNPNRGDVVVVRYPGDPDNKKYVKRVVGLPGETVTITDGRVSIDGRLLPEDYLSFDVASYPGGEWQLENEKYFLMGDNRPNSNDSRYFGPVEKRFLDGKALRIIYPRFRMIE